MMFAFVFSYSVGKREVLIMFRSIRLALVLFPAVLLLGTIPGCPPPPPPPDGGCATDPDCDDSEFCTGQETCSERGTCVQGEPPCEVGEDCNEDADRCEVPCVPDADCADGDPCTADYCTDGICRHDEILACPPLPPCGTNAECDDGEFCNGVEDCDTDDRCQSGNDPCPDQLCRESDDTCVDCLDDGDCDDSLFCNGAELCVDDECQPADPPCADDATCNEEIDACEPESSSEKLAFEHLAEVMDQFHTRVPVYTDLSAAENHFVMLGRMSSSGDQDKVEINPGYALDCFSGSSCIENRFFANGDNWGGWYFMNGVLEGDETQPKPNWGDYPDAGVDLTGAETLTFHAKGKRGGERVEFFAFGVGRDADTGAPNAPYPDSSPTVSLGYVVLTDSWTQYVIDPTNSDLSYVLGGFGWVTNARRNSNQDITFYLDQIVYDKSRLDDPRFLVSYETIPSPLDFDVVLKNTAFTYDNALVLIAFLARGTDDDMQRAKLLADAFVYAIDNDRYFSDGRLRNAYQAGDLALFPGWKPNGRDNTVRMPGWWDSAADLWYEDRFAVGSNSGNLAWAMIALLSYYEHAAESEHLDAAQQLANWIEAQTKDTRGAGGYTGGYDGWETTSNNPAGQTKNLWKSTENNTDIYVAFARLYEATGEAIWKDRALHAKAFVESMWDDNEGHFWTGSTDDGSTVNTDALPADVNTWALMALGNAEQYGPGISWVNDNCYVEADGFKGFDFNDDRDHVWFEGTAHMVLAFTLLEDTTNANTYLSELEKAQISATNSNQKGLVAASYDGLTTGFDWLYYNRLHIGATAWFIFAERGYNPYWGIGISDPVPAYNEANLVQFDAPAYSVREDAGSAVITVRQNGGQTGEITVMYATSNGTATAGSDFVTAAGTLVFAEGETSKSFTITIVDDTAFEDDETVNLFLSDPTGGASLGEASTTVLTILDDDVPAQVQFNAPAYSVLEAEGSATITVDRSGDDTIQVVVTYTTGNGTATAGADYVAASGTLVFAEGETSKSFSITIVDDSDFEDDETVNLVLSDPTGGASLGDASTAVLTVFDDDGCVEQTDSYQYDDFTLTNVCTPVNNFCGYADRPGKAVVYGEMSKVVSVPSSCEKLDVTIFIPCNGWGEGLAGPDGSSAHVIVNGVIREEPIDDTMPYHHGGYYRYEYCQSFINTYDVTGETQAELIIRVNGGAWMDFQEARLRWHRD